MEAFSKQEQSRQEEFKAMQKDRELEIERLKKNALSESFQHQKEMKRHEHDLAMKKAQYEDQLRSVRKDRDDEPGTCMLKSNLLEMTHFMNAHLVSHFRRSVKQQ